MKIQEKGELTTICPLKIEKRDGSGISNLKNLKERKIKASLCKSWMKIDKSAEKTGRQKKRLWVDVRKRMIYFERNKFLFEFLAKFGGRNRAPTLVKRFLQKVIFIKTGKKMPIQVDLDCFNSFWNVLTKKMVCIIMKIFHPFFHPFFEVKRSGRSKRQRKRDDDWKTFTMIFSL